jgi:hypothetical protein
MENTITVVSFEDTVNFDVACVILRALLLRASNVDELIKSGKRLRLVNKLFMAAFDEDRRGCRCLARVLSRNLKVDNHNLWALSQLTGISNCVYTPTLKTTRAWLADVKSVLEERVSNNGHILAAQKYVLTGEFPLSDYLMSVMGGASSSERGFPRGRWTTTRSSQAKPLLVPKGVVQWARSIVVEYNQTRRLSKNIEVNYVEKLIRRLIQETSHPQHTLIQFTDNAVSTQPSSSSSDSQPLRTSDS